MMLRTSNTVLAIMNLGTLLLSIPIIYIGYQMGEKGHTECTKFLEKPILILGIFLFVVSFMGMVGACCRMTALMWIYMCLMCILIIVLTCFTIFAFVVTHKGAGETLEGRGYREFRLADYSTWLQEKVTNNWGTIGSCLVDSKVCDKMAEERTKLPAQFEKEPLSPLESGCCKPSSDCNFQYLTPTNWTRTPASRLTNPDCIAWNNDPNIYCYSCQACKAGLIEHIKSSWKRVSVTNVISLLVLSIIYSVACCAFDNIREEQAWRRMERIPLYRGV